MSRSEDTVSATTKEGTTCAPEVKLGMPGAPAVIAHLRARFPIAPRSIWKDVPDSDWTKWQWQQRNRVTSLDTLEKIIPIDGKERQVFEQVTSQFHMGITPYYASLIDPENPLCPIRQQSVPSAAELHVLPTDLADPLAEERDMPVPGLTHRYPDRVLLYVTHNCPVYCRHCTRKRKVADPSRSTLKKQLDDGIAYIEAHREVRDVVISGGDPLSLSDDRLDEILGRLRAIDHVEIVRLGTRNPVTLPQRITEDFAKMLARHQPVFVNTHFNHPRECTAEAYEAARRLANAGCPIGNQMVLLRGINDDPAIVKELNQKLLMMRIRPYYIYQCDQAKGIGHFRTRVAKGIEILQSLRGFTSGLAVPYFVVDAPNGGGKIPLLHNYVVEHEGNHLMLCNYAGKIYRYEEPED